MLRRLLPAPGTYPGQYWLLVWGMLVNSIGSSLVWPFLTIYVRERLGVSLTVATLLLTLQSVTGLVATSVAGPAMDRIGRKGIMVFALFGSSAVLVGMGLASDFVHFAAVLGMYGGLVPLYRIGTNTVIADVLEPERRADAYALLRTVHNLGVALGPAIGGFLAAISYQLAFNLSAVTHLAFGLLVALRLRETLKPDETGLQPRGERSYLPVLRDRPFLTYVGLLVLSTMPMALVFVLLPVYVKENFGIPEAQYGFIVTINAAMVVFLQYAITRLTNRFSPLHVLATGALLFALGAGSVALGSAFPAFVASIVVLSIGEMVLVPTSTALAANLAPVDMRARYMGLYSLVWGAAAGIGPVIGGLLNDLVAPAAIWYGALVVGTTGAADFLWLASSRHRREAWTQPGLEAPGTPHRGPNRKAASGSD